MGEIFAALKPYLIPLIAETLAYFFHRRNTDPNFLAKSDEAFSRLVTAQTEEEKLNASKEIQSLISTG